MIHCPQCNHTHIITKDTGKRVASIIGIATGAISGLSSSMIHIRIGSNIGSIAGPPGIIIGTLSGAVISALLGAGAGGITGAQIGGMIDQQILGNHLCTQCGHTFSLEKTTKP